MQWNKFIGKPCGVQKDLEAFEEESIYNYKFKWRIKTQVQHLQSNETKNKEGHEISPSYEVFGHAEHLETFEKDRWAKPRQILDWWPM